MDALLTPLVNSLLKSVIKSASGEAASQLRVSLSRGSVRLQNLELARPFWLPSRASVQAQSVRADAGPARRTWTA